MISSINPTEIPNGDPFLYPSSNPKILPSADPLLDKSMIQIKDLKYFLSDKSSHTPKIYHIMYPSIFPLFNQVWILSHIP